MQSHRGALSRLRNTTSIPLDKLEAHESDRKRHVDVETQAVNQALAMFPTPRYTIYKVNYKIKKCNSIISNIK